MSAIARFVMQGPLQATIAAVMFAIVPLLSWVSGAIVSLVILRQGLTKGLNVLLGALLPGVVWYATQQDFTVFAVVLGSALMAVVLRLSVSLPKAIMASVITGAILATFMQQLSPEVHKILTKATPEIVSTLSKQMPDASSEQIEKASAELTPWIIPMVMGGLAAMMQLLSVGALFLARNWQSTLFNPGGFRQEFHQLRMPIWYGAVVLVLSVFASSSPELSSYIPVLLAPLFIAGIALVHGMVSLKQLSAQWLVAFYISLIILLHYMYALLILIAFVDCIVNFRSRLKDTAE